MEALGRKLKLEDSVNFEEISHKTNFYSGADLKALLYNAQLKSIHRTFPDLTLIRAGDKRPENVSVEVGTIKSYTYIVWALLFPTRFKAVTDAFYY